MNALQIVLKQLREKKGISQYRLAEDLKMPQSNIAMYESGRRTPPPNVLEKIADYFNVSVDYLLGRTEKPNGGLVIPSKMTNVSVEFAEINGLTQQEFNLINQYRQLDKYEKETLKNMLAGLTAAKHKNESEKA